MKILLVAHGYPPDDVDVIARAVRSDAHALTARGHVCCVVAGTSARDGGEARLLDCEPETRTKFPVLRLSRSDLHPEHWQKSASSSIPARFRRLIRDFEPDVVHVHHWQRLSRDLVACAAAERVPAVVTLHDAWTTCLLATRKRPHDGSACDASFAPMPCLACAGTVAPKTPFMPLDQLFLMFASHRVELARELNLARAVLLGTSARADVLAQFLPEEARGVAFAIAADVSAQLEQYERARAAGAPPAPSDVDAWYGPRMRAFSEENWDRSFRAARAGETST